MKIKSAQRVRAEDITEAGAQNARIRWLISRKDGAPNFAMRLIEVGPGGQTPLHRHEWEHEVFVLRGNGELINEKGMSHPFSEGKAVLIRPNELHQFRNTGPETLRLICVVPITHP